METLLIADGHHRLKAMENLDQLTVPVEIRTLESYTSPAEIHALAVTLEAAKLTKYYKGDVVINSTIGNVRADAYSFVKTYFPYIII